jgi:hypothetical protein
MTKEEAYAIINGPSFNYEVEWSTAPNWREGAIRDASRRLRIISADVAQCKKLIKSLEKAIKKERNLK